jgi:hypothetical protein
VDLLLGKAEVPVYAQTSAFQAITIKPGTNRDRGSAWFHAHIERVPIVGVLGVPPLFKFDECVSLALPGPPVDADCDVPHPAAPFHVIGEVAFPVMVRQVADEEGGRVADFPFVPGFGPFGEQEPRRPPAHLLRGDRSRSLRSGERSRRSGERSRLSRSGECLRRGEGDLYDWQKEGEGRKGGRGGG